MLRALRKCYDEFLTMFKFCFAERSKMCLLARNSGSCAEPLRCRHCAQHVVHV